MYIFEWDSDKSQRNVVKHGVSFDEARQLWDSFHIEVKEVARAGEEKRSATLGLIHGKVYVAIWTLRKNSIRIISVRRARTNEEKIYKKN